MKRCLHTVICLLAALHLLGGHWGVLQMVAWTQMLNDYSKDKGILVAVKETFDGEHPCPMCLKIKEGKKQEGESEPLIPQSKTDKSYVWMVADEFTRLPARSWSQEALVKVTFADVQRLKAQWASLPATPPPRRGVV